MISLFIFAIDNNVIDYFGLNEKIEGDRGMNWMKKPYVETNILVEKNRLFPIWIVLLIAALNFRGYLKVRMQWKQHHSSSSSQFIKSSKVCEIEICFVPVKMRGFIVLIFAAFIAAAVAQNAPAPAPKPDQAPAQAPATAGSGKEDILVFF